MASEGELEFQSKVIALARSLGWKCAHFRHVRVLTQDGRIRWMTPVQADGKGFVDVIAARGKRLLVAELKIEGGTLADDQADWLAAFAAAGVEWHIWLPWQWNEIEECLRRAE